MNEKYYWYTPLKGQKRKVRLSGEPDADGKQQIILDDGQQAYLTPDEVKGLQAVEEEPTPDPSQKEGSYEDYDGLANIDFSALTEEAPTTQPLSDSDWLASLTPDAKKREKALKGKKALDALNMVSQTIQVLGRLGNTSQGAGYAQPMVPDGYQKFMDRAYQQGMNYENTLAAREKVINADRKLRQDWEVKKQKMALDRELFELRKQKADAVARQDKKREAVLDAQIEYVKAKKQALEARTNVLNDATMRGVAVKEAVGASQVAKNQSVANKNAGGQQPETPSNPADDERKKRQSYYDKYVDPTANTKNQ